MLISFFSNGYICVLAYLSHGLSVPRKYHVILAIITTQKHPKTSAEQRAVRVLHKHLLMYYTCKVVC